MRPTSGLAHGGRNYVWLAGERLRSESMNSRVRLVSARDHHGAEPVPIAFNIIDPFDTGGQRVRSDAGSWRVIDPARPSTQTVFPEQTGTRSSSWSSWMFRQRAYDCFVRPCDYIVGDGEGCVEPTELAE